jgi:hypothetical protein
MELWDVPLAAMRAGAALRPYVEPRRGWLRDPGFCPLNCGFQLSLDWDNHFFPCLLRRGLGVWFHPQTTGIVK